MINYYQELELNEELEGEDLRKELLRSQKKWLNRTNSSDLDKRMLAEKRLEYIDEALDVLVNPVTRKDYDQQLNDYNASHSNQQSRRQAADLIDTDELSNNILNLVELEKYTQAIEQAKYLTETEPNKPRSWRMLGYAQSEFGNYDIAIKDFQKAIDLDAGDVASYLEIGRIYKEINQPANALRYYKQALKIDPENEIALGNAGVLLKNNREYEASLPYFEKLVELYPTVNNKEFLADNYFKIGLYQLPSDTNNEFYLFEEEHIEVFLEYANKANELYPSDHYKNQIKDANKSLKKTYDWSKITLLTIPLFFMETPLLAMLLAGVIIYYSIRPRWVIERRKTFGTKTPFDTVSNVYTKTAGAIIVFFVMFIGGIIGATFDSTKYY